MNTTQTEYQKKMAIDIEEITSKPYIVKAYTTPNNRFMTIENRNGAVITLWKAHNGYQLTQPITPNTKTGSSVGITGDYWDYVTHEEMLNILETHQTHFPNFYSSSDREATHFQTIEQAVNTHGNILKYNKIK